MLKRDNTIGLIMGGALVAPGRRIAAITAIIALMGLGISGLNGCANNSPPLPVTADSIAVPFQLFSHVNLVFYDGARKKWKLDALTMRKELDSRGLISVMPVRLTLFDSLGLPGTTVTADSGTTNGNMENFTAWGNVYITTSDHMIIKTEKLRWDKNTRKVLSDTYVQIQTARGDIMRGKGLDAQEDFSEWSFRSNVSGAFPNFKDRFEGEDQLF